MEAPDSLKYTEQHAWVRLSGRQAVIGLTDVALDELGFIVFIELPQLGDRLVRGEPYGSVETVEATADLYAPVTGTVIRVNDVLQREPFRVNTAPYAGGWIAVVEMADPGEADKLWSSRQYRDRHGE